MTYYFSSEMASENFDRACKKLKTMKGKTLSWEQIKSEEFFGHFNDCGSSTAESRDAFSRAVETGLLIEESPGQFRVSSVGSRNEAKKVCEKERDKIFAIIQKVSQEIKAIILQKVKEKESVLPLVAVCGSKEKLFKDCKKIKALIVNIDGHKQDGHYSTGIIFLTTEGLFESGYKLFSTNMAIKKWDHIIDNPYLWVNHGEEILTSLTNL